MMQLWTSKKPALVGTINYKENNMKEVTLIAALVLIVTGMSLAGKFDRQEAERASAEYTEMVCLFKETSGEFGWPDFKNLKITCGE